MLYLLLLPLPLVRDDQYISFFAKVKLLSNASLNMIISTSKQTNNRLLETSEQPLSKLSL